MITEPVSLFEFSFSVLSSGDITNLGHLFPEVYRLKSVAKTLNRWLVGWLVLDGGDKTDQAWKSWILMVGLCGSGYGKERH